MLCDWLSLLMNVTWLPRATMMFFGLTVLFVIVIVVAFTAPDGVVLGLVGLELELDPEELPHAPIPNAVAAAKAAAVQICRLRLLSMLPLDPNPAREVTFLVARPRIARIAGCGHVDAAEHGRRMNRAVILSAG